MITKMALIHMGSVDLNQEALIFCFNLFFFLQLFVIQV